jgi:uncharacterized membrane protein
MLTIFTFLGRLHPLVVHLPIGFLLLAVLFDGVSYIKGYAHLKPAVSFTLLAGFAAAVIACIFGYLLSLTGDYDPTILSHHMISGITLAILSGLLFFTTTQKFKTFYQLPSGFFSCLLAGLVILIGYSGHQGGNLTHGSDYLNLKILAEGQRNHPARVEDALIFEDVVHPILESKCGKCHEGGKLKGKLSMADLKSLLKGGKTGPAVVPGRLSESELYRRITLPPDQEKFMPSDGKPPLTATEVTIIRWWIEKANAAEGKKMSELKDKDVITPQVAYVLGLGGAAAPGDVAGASGKSGTSDTSFPAQQINPDIPPVMDRSLVDNLRKKGLMVRVLLQSPLMLDVVLPAGSGMKMARIKDDLVRAGKNIIWLNLSDNGFTENDLGFLKQLPNIKKLRLEKNPISDGISDDVVTLKHLEAINLNETKISSACLAQLVKNPALKRIYTWKTAVKEN